MAQPRILVVEDDPLLVDLLAQKLSEESIEHFFARDGEQALVIAKKEKPDIMLLDILLPGMDGFTVLEKLKADPDTRGIRVVVLSNLSQDEDIKKSMSLGAEKHIVKVSLSLDEVVNLIRSMSSDTAAKPSA